MFYKKKKEKKGPCANILMLNQILIMSESSCEVLWHHVSNITAKNITIHFVVGAKGSAVVSPLNYGSKGPEFESPVAWHQYLQHLPF